MKRAFTIIYSILSIIVFLALFLFSGLALYGIYQANHAVCIGNLNNAKSLFVMWQQGVYSSRELETAVEGILQKFNRLLVITLYSPAKGIFYTSSRPAPKASGYLQSAFNETPGNAASDWQGRPVYQDLPVAGTEIIEAGILTDPANELVVEGVYSVLTYNEIFNVLKYGFLAITILLIISIFIRFFIANEDKSSRADYYFDKDLPLPEDLEMPASGKYAVPDENVYEKKEESLHRQTAAPSERISEDEKNTAEGLPDNPEQAGTAFEQIKKAPGRDLFSPGTGLGWEEHLLPRLGAEIKRTSSFDQDMSFALMCINHYKSLKQPDAVLQDTAKIILELFLFQDLCFEYSSCGFGIILPDIDINQAIKEMEIFQRKIAGTQIREQFISVSIGISSRNGRLITGDTLFTEAEKALEKAAVDQKNNIVAFKTDPDKYRNSVAKKV